MFNEAEQYQGSRAGTYEVTTPVNGKHAWISTSGNAIWHSGSQWIFGSASDIGSGYAGISANDDADCPQDVSSWNVWGGIDVGSVEVPSSDVSFECYEFIGNDDFQKSTYSWGH